MKHKLVFLFFFSFLLIKTVISHEVIDKYDELEIDEDNKNEYVFLDISDFDEDEKIYITITGKLKNSRDGNLYYEFYENIDSPNFSPTTSHAVHYKSTSRA